MNLIRTLLTSAGLAAALVLSAAAADRQPGERPVPVPVVIGGEMQQEQAGLLGGSEAWRKYVRTEPVGWRYIDRIQIDSGLMAAYHTLAEACDGDGDRDYILEDRYYAPGSGLPEDTWSPGTVRSYTGEDGAIHTELLGMILRMPGDTDWAEQQRRMDEVYDQGHLMYSAFARDYPEAFWVGTMTSSWAYSWETDPVTGAAVDVWRYFIPLDHTILEEKYPRSLVRELQAEVKTNVDRILAEGSFTAETSDVEKVHFFSNWLVRHNNYNSGNTGALYAHNCIWALRGGSGAQGPVCEGYSEAFKILCDTQDIPCVLVCGNNHMWNNVQVQGTWYAMDVTWNDPIGGGSELECYTLVGTKNQIRGNTFESEHPPVENGYFMGYYGAFDQGPRVSTTACMQLHRLRWEETPADCETPGSRTGWCSHCRGLLLRETEETPALGHQWVWKHYYLGWTAECSRNPSHGEQFFEIKYILVQHDGFQSTLPQADRIFISADLRGAYHDDLPLNVYFAIYDADGRMLALKRGKVGRNEARYPEPYDNRSGEAKLIKAFALNDDGALLCDSVSFCDSVSYN